MGARLLVTYPEDQKTLGAASTASEVGASVAWSACSCTKHLERQQVDRLGIDCCGRRFRNAIVLDLRTSPGLHRGKTMLGAIFRTKRA